MLLCLCIAKRRRPVFHCFKAFFHSKCQRPPPALRHVEQEPQKSCKRLYWFWSSCRSPCLLSCKRANDLFKFSKTCLDFGIQPFAGFAGMRCKAGALRCQIHPRSTNLEYCLHLLGSGGIAPFWEISSLAKIWQNLSSSTSTSHHRHRGRVLIRERASQTR